MGAVLAEDERLEDRATDEAGNESPAPGESTTVHRLRDLDRRSRWVAAAFAAALLLAPVLAFARYLPEWVPSGDPAYMGLRALDVGTSRTPLLGQPSTSAEYVDGKMVHHLGPTHFYLLAPAMRLLGASTGMLLVSVIITGGSLLVAAWAVFRQLGRAAGAVAVVVLSITTFTTGASSLVNPVSSSISGYPLLCSAVLLWCLLCGDLRLMPLTAFWVSFTAQQHLAVLPAVAVMTAVGLVGCCVLERGQGRRLARWGGISAAVALVVWSPVILQELFGAAGNLSQLREFTGHSDRPKLGLEIAFRQVVHALGLPPLLGQTDLSGGWFFGELRPLTWVSAGLLVVVLVLAAVRWGRLGDRRRVAFVAMALVAAVAGLVNGSSVPKGIEQFRLPFYHWAFVLTFFVTSILLLLGGELARRVAPQRQAVLPWLRTAVLPALGVAVVVVPSIVNPTLDRRSNTLLAAYAPVKRAILDELADDVMADRGELEGPIVVLTRGEGWYVGLREAISLELDRRGLDIRHPRGAKSFVDDEHLAYEDDVQGALVLVVDKELQQDAAAAHGVPGELLSDIDSRGTIDWEAFEQLVAEAEATDEVVLGPEIERMLAEMGTEAERTMVRQHLQGFAGERARLQLSDRGNLQFLLETPLEKPAFDADLLRRVLETLPGERKATDEPQWRLRVYRLDREQLLDWAGWELVG